MKQLIECVPNFSEGRDMHIIKQITNEIEAVEDVQLLNVDPGKAANRTVVTFVGTPQAVCEAAFRAVSMASRLIDMRKHKGEHPRIGATDVLPLVPVVNISISEVLHYALKLSERIGTELHIPVYCYEYAANTTERRNLANCRAGQYEGLLQKMAAPNWKPDFGPSVFSEDVARTGAIVLGVRNFLIAYNVNLDTTSVPIAQKIACELREKGCAKRKNGASDGEKLTTPEGKTVFVPGKFKKVKAIGWFIEDYGIAQVSFNLIDYSTTSMHQVFEATVLSAQKYGAHVTGSELIGMLPLKAMLDAGRYFLEKQKLPTNISERELVDAAVRFLKLDDLAPFDVQQKIIEYRMAH